MLVTNALDVVCSHCDPKGRDHRAYNQQWSVALNELPPVALVAHKGETQNKTDINVVKSVDNRKLKIACYLKEA
jgi:hypothetical protein